MTKVVEAFHLTLVKEVSKAARKEDYVNHTIFHNKDGKLAWRAFSLIHPVLYVDLVMAMTENAAWSTILSRFQEFSSNTKIECLSVPVVSLSKESDKAEQISQWWQEVEQRSIELSLEYQNVIVTDITDCYGSIYTHSIAWALHTKKAAKENRDRTLIGNGIDQRIQDMRNGQTNGIPQGSVLMDFIAEMVLGLADHDLSDKILNVELELDDYHIIRYRDDYRIFFNNLLVGETIMKLLSETLADLSLKLNPSKTTFSSEVVHSSIKTDKRAWMNMEMKRDSRQRQLLIIHEHSRQFPNSGSLLVSLTDFHRSLLGEEQTSEGRIQQIAIVTDIACQNPRTYAACAAILSALLNPIESTTKKIEISRMIRNRFEKTPNAGFLLIWLQRITCTFDKTVDYQEPICKLVSGQQVDLWSSGWLNNEELKKAMDSARIIDQKELAEIEPVIPLEEFEIFEARMYESALPFE